MGNSLSLGNCLTVGLKEAPAPFYSKMRESNDCAFPHLVRAFSDVSDSGVMNTGATVLDKTGNVLVKLLRATCDLSHLNPTSVPYLTSQDPFFVEVVMDGFEFPRSVF